MESYYHHIVKYKGMSDFLTNIQLDPKCLLHNNIAGRIDCPVMFNT